MWVSQLSKQCYKNNNTNKDKGRCGNNEKLPRDNLYIGSKYKINRMSKLGAGVLENQ